MGGEIEGKARKIRTNKTDTNSSLIVKAKETSSASQLETVLCTDSSYCCAKNNMRIRYH